MSYYNHKHFYLSQAPVGHWILYATPARCISCFSSSYYGSKVRNRLQAFLEVMDFKDLEKAIDFLIDKHVKEFIASPATINEFLKIGSLKNRSDFFPYTIEKVG